MFSVYFTRFRVLLFHVPSNLIHEGDLRHLESRILAEYRNMYCFILFCGPFDLFRVLCISGVDTEYSLETPLILYIQNGKWSSVGSERKVVGMIFCGVCILVNWPFCSWSLSFSHYVRLWRGFASLCLWKAWRLDRFLLFLSLPSWWFGLGCSCPGGVIECLHFSLTVLLTFWSVC